MTYLVDTPMLMRLANLDDPQYEIADHAVVTLRRRGERLRIAPQNLIEFRNSATRPVSANGLGLSPSMAETLAGTYETAFPLLSETPDIYPAWKQLVQGADVIGKQVHDARLVAICQVYGITHILTFNVSHFTRLTAQAPGIAVVDPKAV